MDAVRPMRINLIPISSNTFRLDDDLYITDSLDSESFFDSMSNDFPVKLEIYAMLFCRKGSISGRINQKDLSVGDNGIMVLMPGSIIEHVSITDSSEIVLLAFNRETLLRDFHSKGIQDFISKSYQLQDSEFYIEADKMENFILFYRAISHMLIHEQDKEKQNNILQGCAYIVVNFFQEWIKASVMQDHKEQTRAQRVVSDFINDLHQHVLEERNLAFYADRASLSTKHFSRLVIQQTGKRPLDHIRDYLALEAKCMLAAKKYTIKQISDRLYFSNTSAFTRFFRLATGNTPAEFINTV